jgi:hypothetical protein
MKGKKTLVVCVRNDQYPASLERRKIYELLPDSDAERHGQVRIVDESGEDYLYPADYFVQLDLPQETEKAVIEAA